MIISKISFNLEKDLYSKGINQIIGLDEVGRGSLVGPVVVAAVGFGQDHQDIDGIDDSKKLSASKRLELFDKILSQAEVVSCGLVDVDLIDEINILEATKYAMVQAIAQLDPDLVLVDGRDVPDWDQCPVKTIIGGDRNCYSIAAASIVAKVVRDTLIEELHHDFPVFDWCKNKGYGTKNHREAIKIYGPTIHHRQKFIRKILAQN